MSYEVKVLADSISPEDVRLTTLECTFPRFILAEMNTHTLFSRNSASSRAIPTEKIIERVMGDPFIPATFNKRIKGMGVGVALESQERSRNAWLTARDEAVNNARVLVEEDVDKSRVNRLLEPFMWHTAIITATEWDNFMALRQPADGEVPQLDFPAQPEMQIAARCMREAMEESEPRTVAAGEWGHLPLVEDGEADTALHDFGDGVVRIGRDPVPNGYSKFPHPLITIDYDEQDRPLGISAVGPQCDALRAYLPMVSGGRCARVSFDTQGVYEAHVASFVRALGLRGNGHLSPFQHPARPFTREEWELVRRQQDLIEEFCVYTRESDSREGIPEQVELEMMRRAKMCGNYCGWVPLRKMIDNEWNFDGVLNVAATRS